MKSLLLPVALGCISLLCLHLSACRARTLALRYQDLPPEPRKPPDREPPYLDQNMGLLNRILTESGSTLSLNDMEEATGPLNGRIQSPTNTKSHWWLPHRTPSSAVPPDPARPRLKRHAHYRGHRPQLMRVGCSLGTCQVQNLSHRLWQLMGQSGREDSSPIDPNSPHSYG
ncbi:protein ADM2 [Ambystoma mexicanum]|uniref:protein ADM2 n=1 Tax=Ambystoma mexicanum TaxID=8296 RepID=UPI0037E9BABE